MKKIITILLCVAVVAIGFYFLVSKKPTASPTGQSGSNPATNKFSSQDKISSADVVVKVTDTGFVPDTVSIKKGTPVVWLNQTSNFVWPASDSHPIHTNYPGFDPQEPFKNSETWTFTFDRAGNWGYHDHLKPSMKGNVQVLE